MGHLVNPVSYRIGVSKCWNSVWAHNLSYSMSHSSLIRSDYDIFLFFRRFFELKLLSQGGYIFSHVKVIRDRLNLSCVVYFYDGGSLERSDNMRHIVLSGDFQIFILRNVFFLSLSSFLRLYQWNFNGFSLLRNFKFSFLFNYFARKKRFLRLRVKVRSFFYRKLFLLYLESLKVTFGLFGFYLLNSFYYNDKMLSDNFELLFNLNYFYGNSHFFGLNFIFFRCVFVKFFESFCNDFLFFYEIVYEFFKLFDFCFQFRKIHMKEIFSLIFILRWKMILKMQLSTRMVKGALEHFAFNRYFLYYFGDLFFFSTRMESRLKIALNTVFKNLVGSKNFRIYLKKLEVTELTAAVISKYLAVRLRQRFQLKEALLPMLRHLSNTFFVRGFRVVCAGRFTRKEIALYDLRTYSSVPFSGATSRLDFSLAEVVLKYSICGIKVWLHKRFVSENFFGIRGIGLNFLQIPVVSQNFFDILEDHRRLFSNPYEHIPQNVKLFEFSKRKIKKQGVKATVIKGKMFKLRLVKTFVAYAFRDLPSVDFFFASLNYLKKNLMSRSKDPRRRSNSLKRQKQVVGLKKKL